MTNQTPAPSSHAARKRMKAARSRDTKPELALRSELHQRGLRFRVDQPVLEDRRRRRADLVFASRQVAVFVDGCFWHGCPTHGTWPKSNAEWWRAKINTNRARDADTNAELRRAGWIVVRVWEHELAVDSADRVEVALRMSDASRGDN